MSTRSIHNKKYQNWSINTDTTARRSKNLQGARNSKIWHSVIGNHWKKSLKLTGYELVKMALGNGGHYGTLQPKTPKYYII